MVHSVNEQTNGSVKPGGLVLLSNGKSKQPAGKLLVSINDEELERADNVITAEEFLRETADSVPYYDPQPSGSKGFDTVDSVPSCIPLDDEGTFEYNMSHPERGCFIIFNQEIFDPQLGLDDRIGTRKDAYSMVHAAKHMGYEYVKTLHNCTRTSILQWMRVLSEGDHSSYDSFGCAILTHGGENDELYAKDNSFKLSECTEMFQANNCPSLARKPKLFFIQACRGNNLDNGSRINLMKLSNPLQPVSVRIPNQSDFLIARSTTPGHMAWRNKANGSWFVQSLHHCITRYAKTLELMQIMTRVNNKVALHFESNPHGSADFYKQIPSVSSQLTAEVYFHKTKVEQDTRRQTATVETSVDDITSQSQSSSDNVSGSSSKLSRSKSIRKWIRKSLRRRATRS